MSEDAYKILGILQGASLEEVQRAFRQKSAITHPDRIGGGSREEFERITRARDELILLNEKEQNKKCERSTVVSETVNWEQMDVNEHGNGRIWECRCGGWFEMDAQEEKSEWEIVVECDGCSLGLKVIKKRT